MSLGIRTYIRKHMQRETYIGSFLRMLTGERLPSTRIPLTIDHLRFYTEEEAMGPLQRSEALFLYAIVQVIRPRLMVEFGFNEGHSAINFLKAGGPNMTLHSYDISPQAQEIAKKFQQDYSNFKFHFKSQTDFTPQDIGHSQVDLVFIDASHNLQLNQQTWNALEVSLASNAMIIVHDTGTWNREHFRPANHWFTETQPRNWITGNEFAHQPEERRFVNWIVEKGSGFVAIHFHSLNVLRHGITVLQRGIILPVPSTHDASQSD